MGDSLLPSQSNVKHQKCQQELSIGYCDTLLLLLREIHIVPFEIELFWALRSRNLMETAVERPANFTSSFSKP